MNRFPRNFWWGVATSAYQIEGGNFNNDWHEWEEKGKTKDKCGQACDYWNRFKSDHDIISELGASAFRLSIEWSRVEPEEGKFDEQAIQHYRDILIDLKKRNIKIALTLWHWPIPIWLVKKYGGAHNTEFIQCFEKYCEKIVSEFVADADVIITINEPAVIQGMGYISGIFPPGKHNPFLYLKVKKILQKSHRAAYGIVKKFRNDLPVGVAQFCSPVYSGNIILRPIAKFINIFLNWSFFEAKYHDYIGIDYYSAKKIDFTPPFIHSQKDKKELSDFKWGIYAKGIYDIVTDAWKIFQKPIYIFENGIADADDSLRAEFIEKHLEWLGKAIDEGADVRGYFHWSLMDNFEWAAGYDMRFGLVEVDFKTQERKPRPSFYAYKKIIQENS